MLPAAFSTEPESNEARLYEHLILDGIMAVKSGNLTIARQLLNQAASINSADARIWVWLSATTDDLLERRSYLENALEIDPSNPVAKRGLLLLDARLAESHPHPGVEPPAPPESQPVQRQQPPVPVPAVSYTFGLPPVPPPGAEPPAPPESQPVQRQQPPVPVPAVSYTFGLPPVPPPEVQEISPAETSEPLPGELESILPAEAQEIAPAEELQPLPEAIEEILSSEPGELEPSTFQEEQAQPDGGIRTIGCPNCGGIISYDADDTRLVCPICGFTRWLNESIEEEASPQELEDGVDNVPSIQWSEGQARLACELCGTMVLLTPGQNIDSCPNCASTRLAVPTQLLEMVDPQATGTFTIDADQAARAIKSWLGKGFLSPDNLAARHAGMQLHPAYYPFWLISGKLEVPWFSDVKISTGNLAKWEAQSGTELTDFDEMLIPAISKLSDQELAAIGPFNLDALAEFSPATLAGWPVLAYDVPLADASTRARDTVIDKVQRGMANKVAEGQSKRNFRIGDGRWSDLASRLILLPIYFGNYPFQGKRFRLLVNGQTGKVGGKKPIDRMKTTLYVTAGITLLIVAILLIWLLSR